MKLGDKIYSCRKKAGLSQEALAEKIGVSRQAISKWEVGTAVPELGNIAALAKIFGVTTDWLLDEYMGEDDADEEKSESADEESMANNAEKEQGYQGKTENSTSAHSYDFNDQFNRNVGYIGRLIKRYGWISGVYLAVCGGGAALLGAVLKFIVNSMMTGFSNATTSMTSGMFGGGDMQFYTVDGQPVDAGLSAEIERQLSSNFGSSAATRFEPFAEYNPVSIIANIMIVVGIIVCIVGIILAFYLKSKGSESEK